MNIEMQCNGYKATIMEAPRLIGDHTHALPPGTALEVYEVDSFKEKAPHWIIGEGSYVVKVNPDKGLWFDWRANPITTAILPSIKGCNPITGQLIDGFSLEQYKTKCPVHNIDFESGLKCPECGYKWAPQNYIATPNYLWWDGFRTQDGEVRQFFFSEDMKRDVATGLLGKENTVPAFGFAFYKNTKMPIMNTRSRGVESYSGYVQTEICYNDNSYLDCSSGAKGVQGFQGPQGVFGVINSCAVNSVGAQGYTGTKGNPGVIGVLSNQNLELNFSDISPTLYCVNSSDTFSTDTLASRRLSSNRLSSVSVEPKAKVDVAVGAGAKIHQSISADKADLSDYTETPEAIIRVYFVFETEFNMYASKGFISSPRREGYLANITVG